MSRLRVVDNSAIGKEAMAEGRPPKVIHVYTKTGVGTIGDKVLMAIKGEKKKGILVGVKKHQPANIPKFDTNNVVLIDDSGTPLGTRIHAPVPHLLRTILKERTIAKKCDYSKLIAIAPRFV
ncbi:ribosomal protein L14 [Nesidiocoris tenuis]|nr:ribosomal protein L14 [Nesidiocoris tenuis]